MTIGDATPGAAIYYTLDGIQPSATSTLYSRPLTVSATETISAIAIGLFPQEFQKFHMVYHKTCNCS